MVAALSMMEWNQGNGKCFGTYWSVAFAEPGFGTGLLVGSLDGAPQAETAWVAPLASGLPRSCA